MSSISLLPAVCALCTRPFIKRRAVQCRKCLAVLCREAERACLSLHTQEVHP